MEKFIKTENTTVSESHVLYSSDNGMTSLDDLQTSEQRRVLDTVAEIRKCGLDSFISLPQIVVCGDQSSGKSSVLEALTEIPFPRNDNLCTRYATEIILRRAEKSSLNVKIIPDRNRPANEQKKLENFKETMSDFERLPEVMELAAEEMGIENELKSNSEGSAFSRDVLSITLEGPGAPQLTLVDIPGLIANATLGVTEADVATVAEITNHYISQHRTLCLAVISATNDHANQSIVSRIKKYDPHGDRTLGVITKPDRLDAGSASEKGFIALAQNKDVVYKLGWHVLKNRSFAEGNCSLYERNRSERVWLQTSNFKVLPPNNLGIEALRSRLSALLFEHVKLELPKLRQELETRLVEYERQLANLGDRRVTAQESRSYLTKLSQVISGICKLAVDGHYQEEYFSRTLNTYSPDDSCSVPISRLRALVQNLNANFSVRFQKYAHKYQFELASVYSGEAKDVEDVKTKVDPSLVPVKISRDKTIQWIYNAVARSRGRELVGNYNPLIIGELFREQSSKWKIFAEEHIDEMNNICAEFLKILIKDKCSRDVEYRLWNNLIAEMLQQRNTSAIQELNKIMDDLAGFPMNYDQEYTDLVNQYRNKRQELENSENTCNNEDDTSENRHDNESSENISQHADQGMPEVKLKKIGGMNKSTCEELLDCLFAIYEIEKKTFVSNITTQVVERHIVGHLEEIFDPVAVNDLTDIQVSAICSEPLVIVNQRQHYADRVEILKRGHMIFKNIMGQVSK